MSRADLTYNVRGAVREIGRTDTIAIDKPKAGLFRYRLFGGSVKGAVRIWHGPPHDPVTGEELDRSWRWQATFDGDPVDFDKVWPACCGDPLTQEEYDFLVRRREWAREHAPDSAYAVVGKKIDVFDPANPLPF